MNKRNITYYDIFGEVIIKEMIYNHPTTLFYISHNFNPIPECLDGPSMAVYVNSGLWFKGLFPYSSITEMRRLFPESDFSPQGEAFKKNVLVMLNALLDRAHGKKFTSPVINGVS